MTGAGAASDRKRLGPRMAAVAGFAPDPAIETCWSPARGDPGANPFRLRFPRRFGGGALAEKPETYCASGSALSVIGPGRSLRQAGMKRNRGLPFEQQARCSSLARKAALDPEPVAHDSHLECPPLEETGTGWARARQFCAPPLPPSAGLIASPECCRAPLHRSDWAVLLCEGWRYRLSAQDGQDCVTGG